MAVRANAVILLHKMITDDPTHAAKLLPLIVGKLNESQSEPDLDDFQARCIEHRIMQILLVLQPMLTAVSIDLFSPIIFFHLSYLTYFCYDVDLFSQNDMGSLYTLLWDNLSSERYQPSVRILQEWLLIRISLQNETLRSKMWDLFDLVSCERYMLQVLSNLEKI